MQIKIIWLYKLAPLQLAKKCEHILTIDVPSKINLRWKINATKLIEKYCRKDVRCKVIISNIEYSLSCRKPKDFVSDLAKILIDNHLKKTGKLNIGNVSTNYVKY